MKNHNYLESNTLHIHVICSKTKRRQISCLDRPLLFGFTFIAIEEAGVNMKIITL
jgi:hypothetical protein